jgi:SAM-dependent methyltransferase
MPRASADQLERDLRAIVRDHGPWTANNIALADGVWTMGKQPPRPAERRVMRIVKAVADVSARPPSELRVLDLGCYEGGFSIEFALQGATVTGIDAREEHIVKARFAADALDLDNATFQVGDVRELDHSAVGPFDVVLCLGLLYHLEAAEACALVREMSALTRWLAVIETQVALKPRAEHRHGDRVYRGREYREDTSLPGASVVNPSSFWFTRPSLLNLLSDEGFGTVAECLVPVVESLAAVRDHVAYLAFTGEPLTMGAHPELDDVMAAERLPEHPQRWAHPSQGPLYWLEERLRRRRGGGLPSMFG